MKSKRGELAEGSRNVYFSRGCMKGHFEVTSANSGHEFNASCSLLICQCVMDPLESRFTLIRWILWHFCSWMRFLEVEIITLHFGDRGGGPSNPFHRTKLGYYSGTTASDRHTNPLQQTGDWFQTFPLSIPTLTTTKYYLTTLKDICCCCSKCLMLYLSSIFYPANYIWLNCENVLVSVKSNAYKKDTENYHDLSVGCSIISTILK